MTPRKIARMVLYGLWAATNIFLVKTVGFTAATWATLDWFQILLLALAMNSNVLLMIVAFLDNPDATPEIPKS